MPMPAGPKQFLLDTLPKPLIFALKRFQLKRREAPDYAKWVESNRTLPAPHRYKQQVIREYAQRYQLKTLCETGTFLGLMMEAQAPYFDRLVSIELDYELFQSATKRFDNEPKITIMHGDSGEVIHKVISELKAPALFWLDGHFSGGFTAKGKSECPIYGELESIFSVAIPHVILIDDARCFVGTHDYPTVAELEAFVQKRRPYFSLKNENDVIRIEPRG